MVDPTADRARPTDAVGRRVGVAAGDRGPAHREHPCARASRTRANERPPSYASSQDPADDAALISACRNRGPARAAADSDSIRYRSTVSDRKARRRHDAGAPRQPSHRPGPESRIVGPRRAAGWHAVGFLASNAPRAHRCFVDHLEWIDRRWTVRSTPALSAIRRTSRETSRDTKAAEPIPGASTAGRRDPSISGRASLPRTPNSGEPAAGDAAEVRRTPDSRYIVVRGRLWRSTNPGLSEAQREMWVAELMRARRAVADARRNSLDASPARSRVDVAKTALGERGPVWWDDGAPDYNRKMAANTPYAAWFAEGSGEHPARRPRGR